MSWLRVNFRGRRPVAVVALALVAAGTSVGAGGQASAADAIVPPAAQPVHIHRPAGAALTAPSRAAAPAVVTDYLRSQGHPQTTVSSLYVVRTWLGRGGVTHVLMGQRVSGLRVHDTYVKAAVDAHGRLVHLIESIAAVTGPTEAASIDARGALAAALRRLYPGESASRAATSSAGNVTSFARGARFYTDPTVERVAAPTAAGALATAFVVQTWTDKDNQLHETLIDGSGTVADVEARTSRDSYNVFQESPLVAPQTAVSGPGSGNAESPAGWLFGSTQSTMDIDGYNANAYLDTNADNIADVDPGAAPVADGNFLAAADLSVTPSSEGNRAVAVQNLFYLNNVMHDELYVHGFTEAEGNFQRINFAGPRKGGGDPVLAEAQDGSGTDNANFATPRDGTSPRMQMFLWTPTNSHQVEISAPASIAGTYRAAGAAFGPQTFGPVTADIVLANDNSTGDGSGTTSDACEPLVVESSPSGKTVLADRGSCTFVTKVKNAQNAGAIAVIVANNIDGDDVFTMGGTDETIAIPSVMVGQNDGTTIKTGIASAAVTGTVRRLDAPQIDGDLDADIVFHEYGHGLTWRMIGRMSGAVPGAVGEGMSDALAVIMNDDDVVAEYSASDAGGIRTAPYTNYPRTFGDLTWTQVHTDGELYGAIGWQLYLNYGGAAGRSAVLDDMVDGMNYTPAGPTFEKMRDGILQSIAADPGNTHRCDVWRAFAKYGVGVGAKTRVKGSTVTVTESFAVPADC